MQTFKKQVAALIAEKASAVFGTDALTDGELLDMLEYPPDASMGDLALPCFKLSRTLRRAPVQIATSLAEALADSSVIGKAEALNGYLNISADKAAFAARILGEIKEKGDTFGSPEIGKGKTVVLDYSSPNVAKPFHIGHLGTTVIGHSLKLLHEFAGYKCIGINYLGDWGTQFGKLITAYRLYGSRERVEEREIDELVDLYVRFHSEAEQNESLNDLARAEFKKLEQGDEENLALWRWFVEISLREYKKTYAMLDIEFDSYKGESFYTDKMPAQIERIKEAGILELDDGASVVRLDEWNMPPCLILKRDGSTLYPTRDIAAAVYRKNTYGFDKCIYVTSAGQSLHFAQWFKVLELMGESWTSELVHVPYGTVSINGAKLATRTGNVVLLKDLFVQAVEKAGAITAEKNPSLAGNREVAEAVGVGAIVFHYLSNNRMRDINFILEDALSFDGNTGPYAQYTYARACSLIEKSGIDFTVPSADYAPNDAEFALVRTLALFPERVRAALDEYEPSVVTRYILDLCTAFNRFYHECQILSAEDPAVRAYRVSLTYAAKSVLGRALSLICMRKPEKI